MLVRASKMIEDQVDAIDLNLGCPQHIARRGHYGAFLQDEWELIFEICKRWVIFKFSHCCFMFVVVIFQTSIFDMPIWIEVSNAVKNLKVPVTAKIRVFEDIQKSVDYAKMIEKTGISVRSVFVVVVVFDVFLWNFLK